MSRKHHVALLVRRAAAVTVAGIVAVAFAQTASSFSLGAAAKGGSRETCLFSEQLAKSVSVRRQYLVAVDAVMHKADASAVEGMYDQISPASYTADADGDDYGIFSRFRSREADFVGVDSFSADCLGCHDGVSASLIGVDLRNSPVRKMSRVNSFKSDHPIGMNYNMYVAGGRGYKQVPQDTHMIFVEGKVGCLTCHDPLNPEKGHLVMSDRGSALCRTCHDK